MAGSIPNNNYENYDYLATLESGKMTPNAGNSSFNYMSLIPAITSVIGMGATIADIESQNKALMTNMGNQAESLKFSQNVVEQQLVDLERVMGDQLSASGMEAMKRESRLKAASAETGGTGTSNQDAIMTAEMDKLHRDAVIIRTGDVKKTNKMNEMVASRLGFENTLDSMISGQQSAASAGLQTLNAGMSGINMGLLYLGQSDREDFFGTNTTGEA